MASPPRAVRSVKTRKAAAEESAPPQFDVVTAAAALAGYRIATYVDRERWKDEIEKLPAEQQDYVRGYLRWAWKVVATD